MNIIQKLLVLTLLGYFVAAKEVHGSQVGGTLRYNLASAPTTLNPLSSTDYYGKVVHERVLEKLLERDPDTFEFIPALAKEWTISKDGLTFEFTLREGATWHDGKPLTVEDVKFTYDAIMDPKNKYNTATKRSLLENFKEASIIGPNKIRFVAKTKHFMALNYLGDFFIVPKHIYESPSEARKKELNRTLIGSGPYIFKELRRGKYISLERNSSWWGFKDSHYANMHNFDKILMRFIKEESIALQRLEKGDLDFLPLSAEDYVRKTTGPKWNKTLKKIKYSNKAPKGYGFVAMNYNSPLFGKQKARKAMVHLFNRRLMIEKFLYDMSEPLAGPVYPQSPYVDPSVKVLEYDPELAIKLLREDGWKDTDGDQILDKMIDGKKVQFSFTLLNPSSDMDKYFTIFKEDAKKVGVEVNIKNIEWNAFLALIDERKFDAVALGWTESEVDWDPTQIFHSRSIENKGFNFIGFKNSEVDKLIDQAVTILDPEKRKPLLKKVYKIVAEDVPYIFLFNPTFGFYGVNSEIGRPKDTFEFTVGVNSWWALKP